MTPADRLEQALRELEERKREAAERAAKEAPERERLAALWSKLEELPQHERREVLDAAGLHHISAAARPIEALRGDGFMLRRNRPAPPPPEKVVRGGFIPPASLAQPARWQVWQQVQICPLWQCVALSLDMEPTDRVGEAARRGRGSYSRLPGEYWDRIMVCQANLNLDGPIQPRGGLYSRMLRDVECKVSQSDVAGFLEQAGFEVPDAMRASIQTREPIVEKGSLIKRSALIERYMRQWPTADRDLKDASENGLSQAAKADEHGMWWEGAALAWAKERNKLTTAPSEMPSFWGTPQKK